MKREIAKLVADGLYKQALSLYAQHHSSSLLLHNFFTFPPLLKACAKLRSLTQAQTLHTHLIKTGFTHDLYSSTALTDAYMKLRHVESALKVFDEMPHRNSASLNAVISGFLRNGQCKEALMMFKSLDGVGGFGPNSVTVACLLSASENAKQGKGMHCVAVKMGVESDVYVATSALTMYSNCGEMVSGVRVFEEMVVKNVVSYNAVITGMLLNGAPKAVLDVFKKMRGCSIGERPNSVTLVSVLSASASLSYIGFGRQVHGLILKIEREIDVMTGTALVDMYSKCGCWQLAYRIFEELSEKRSLFTWNAMIAGMMLNAQPEIAAELFEKLEVDGFKPDSVTWNSMISGFSQLRKGVEAFEYFKRMQSTGRAPSLKSVTSLLQACADLLALHCGQEIHGHAIRTEISSDLFFATGLIDMYMKCGQSTKARQIFDSFHVKPDDPAFWNAVISGHGRNGENESAFQMFDQMIEGGVQPNAGTFTSLLSMCSHSGLLEKGWQIFSMMDKGFGMKPTPKHHGCMTDLLGRSCRLDEARVLTQELPEPSVAVSASLLGACECHLDLEVGKEMAIKLSEIGPREPYTAPDPVQDLCRTRQVEGCRNHTENNGHSKI